MISDLSRADKLECIKNLLPKRTLQKVHLVCLTDDTDVINRMLYDLNWMGTDAFLQRFPDHSLDLMVEALHEMYGGKLPSIKEVETKLQQWEYSISVADLAYTPAELDKFGADGWELCAISGKNYHFKRPCNG